MRKTLIILFMLTGILFNHCSDNNVISTKSGVKYTDIIIGEGREAKIGDLITIHFRIWLIQDSTDLFTDWVNDSTKLSMLITDSYQDGEAGKFQLTEDYFVKGSTEGIAGMKVGGKRIIVIPSKLAYGEQGGGPIPPNTDIRVFVEMMNIADAIEARMWDLDDNNIVTSESGLKYIIVEDGEGRNPVEGNVVTVHYSGYFEDDTKFDSSVERDEPFSFVVGNKNVIAGWDEGIRLLKKGGKARFIIPPKLGYGNITTGSIPANSTLIFDVELLDIK